MYSIEVNAGRLIEVQLATPVTETEVQDLIQRVRMSVLAQPGRVVMVGELTRMEVLPGELAAMFTALFTRDNPKVERSAFLVARKRSGFAMQLERMVREANNPARRVFEAKDELIAHLEPSLTPAEAKSLRALLAKASAG